MSNRPSGDSLFLQVSDNVEVPCRRCARTVDFGKACELVRRSDGSLTIVRCHRCVSEDLNGTDGGPSEVPELLPLPGSHWRYTDPRSPADKLEFTFRRFVGEGLVFDGPHGEWFCSREDWANHLATYRVRPFVAAPVRAEA